jgi:hypothetical protein
MTNLKMYGSGELSLRVFNEERLYRVRHDWRYLQARLAEEFEFTYAQLKVLLDDLHDDAEEA